jgi:hypothetical protein
MDRRLKQKKDLLERIFNFLKVDLATLPSDKKRTLINDLIPFFMPSFNPYAKTKLVGDFLNYYEKMNSFYDKNRDKYIEILSRLDLLSHAQIEAKKTLNKLLADGRGQNIYSLMLFPSVVDGIITNIILPSIESNTKAETFPTNLFLINLTNILNEFQVSSIKICPNCRGYFLNLTRRKKKYCSPHCTWRAIAKKKRVELKNHPRKFRAYKIKQAEIMWKRYEEKQKAEYGPKGMISRRVEYTPKGKVKVRKEG